MCVHMTAERVVGVGWTLAKVERPRGERSREASANTGAVVATA